MIVQIECPECPTTFKVDATLLSQSLDKNGQRHLRCSACKHTFVYTPNLEPELEPQAEPVVEPAPEPQPQLQPEMRFPDLAARPLTGDVAGDFQAFNTPKPPKNNPKRSVFTSVLAFLIMLILLVLAGTWVAMTHPEWFQASYWLDTRT